MFYCAFDLKLVNIIKMQFEFSFSHSGKNYILTFNVTKSSHLFCVHIQINVDGSVTNLNYDHSEKCENIIFPNKSDIKKLLLNWNSFYFAIGSKILEINLSDFEIVPYILKHSDKSSQIINSLCFVKYENGSVNLIAHYTKKIYHKFSSNIFLSDYEPEFYPSDPDDDDIEYQFRTREIDPISS